jgi:phosphatidylethanolamine-binding protein (PEBP) family uncharacterized protein
VLPEDVLNTTDNSANAFSWYTPSPPWGAHRYTFLLFWQSKGLLDLDAMRMAAGYPTGTKNTVKNKAYFNVSSFSSQLGLDLMNGKFFYMNCQENCEARCTGDKVKWEDYGAIGSVPALEYTLCEELGNLTIANVDNDGDDDSVFAQEQQWAGTGAVGTYTVLDFLHLTDEMLSHPGVNMTCEMDGVTFGPGTIQDWDTVNQSTLACHIAADDALAGKYYTLLEVDPGVPENGDNWFGVYTHGMWANFQAGQTFNSSNANVIMHASGSPPFGSHRYTFVLFEQMDGYKDLSTYREAVTGQTAVNAYSGHFLKQSAGVGQFARNFDLKVATATYYYQYCTASVMADVYAALSTPYTPYGDGSTCLAYCSFDPDGDGCKAGTLSRNTALYGISGCPCVNGTFGDLFHEAPSFVPTPAPTNVPTPAWSIAVEAKSVAALNGYKNKEEFDSDQETLFKEALVESVALLTAPHQVAIKQVTFISGSSSRRKLLSSSSYVAVNYSMTLYSSESESELESTIKTQLISAFNSTGTGSFASALISVAAENGIVTNATLNRKFTVDQVENDLSFVIAAINPTPVPTTPAPTVPDQPTLVPVPKPTHPTPVPTSDPTPPPTAPWGNNGVNRAHTQLILEAIFIPLGGLSLFVLFQYYTNRHRFEHYRSCERSCARCCDFDCCCFYRDSVNYRPKELQTGFGAFVESGDTENPIIHQETADARTRGLTRSSTRRSQRGASSANRDDYL